MDPLDATVNNFSFVSGQSASLNSSVCHSPTSRFAAGGLSKGRYVPPQTSLSASRNQRQASSNNNFGGRHHSHSVGDRFVGCDEEEDETHAIYARSCSHKWGSPTFSPTHTDLPPSATFLFTPQTSVARAGAGAAESDADMDLDNTARSIFPDHGVSPQGLGRASIGGDEVAAMSASRKEGRLHLYNLEASQLEWASAVAAASSPSSGTHNNNNYASPHSPSSVSSPLMEGNHFRNRAERGREVVAADMTAADIIRGAEEASAANASPHALPPVAPTLNSTAAQALKSLASGDSEPYFSSLAGVLLPSQMSGGGVELGIQSPLRPSPVAASTQAHQFETSKSLTYLRNKNRHFQTAAFRTIPQTPERILDAPELVSDFYLNLLDWSSKNVVSVALSNTCYLWNATNCSITQLMTTNEQRNVITAVSWHAGGDVIAIGLTSGEIKIWNVNPEARCLHTITSHTERVCSLSWHGHLLASGSRDTTIIIHNLQGVVEGDRYPRGQMLAGSGVVLQGHTQEVCGVSWSPDGTQLASGGNDNVLCIWNVKKENLEVSLGWQFSEHTAAIKAIAWNPTRRHCLVTGGGTADKTLRVWNTLTGERTHLVDTRSQVCGIAWNRDGTEFVSSHGFSDNQLSIWRFPTMKKIADLTGHTSRVLHLARSPDGEMVVSAAEDETIRFWRCFAPSSAANAAAKKKAVDIAPVSTEEELTERTQQSSEVAAIVAAVQRDMLRHSRRTVHLPPTSHQMGGRSNENVSPTPLGSAPFLSVQRPQFSNTERSCGRPIAAVPHYHCGDSVENELVMFVASNTVASRRQPPQRASSLYTASGGDQFTTIGDQHQSPLHIQRGSSPLSSKSSLSPVEYTKAPLPVHNRASSPFGDLFCGWEGGHQLQRESSLEVGKHHYVGASRGGGFSAWGEQQHSPFQIAGMFAETGSGKHTASSNTFANAFTTLSAGSCR